MERKERLLEAWKTLAQELRESYGYSVEALTAALHIEGDAIPLTAFGHGMTPLEAAARYLKHTGKNSATIAKTLGRNKSAVERMLLRSHVTAKTLAYSPSDKIVPATVFTGTLPASKALYTYLRERYNMTNKQLADALDIDQRTVWTVLNRTQTKGHKP